MTERARRLHANPHLGVIYVTGGGSHFLSEVLSTPGASKTVLEARVPYAFAALSELLGAEPAQACSTETASAMAMAAFARAQVLGSPQPFGLACTASLATDREKRGAHRAHIALQTTRASYAWHLALSGDRASEEQALVEALWRLADVLNGALPPDPVITTIASDAWQGVVAGTQAAACTEHHDGKLLFPGSFNPMHRGHQHILAVAEAHLGKSAALELSIINVDKPPLDIHAIRSRLDGIQQLGGWPVWLTRLPTFAEKAEHFPGATFAVGVDTIVRVGAPRYYGSARERDRALSNITDLGCRFLVFGRVDNDRFKTLSNVRIPAALRNICDGVDEDTFRLDISSTELRNRHSP